MKQDNPMKPAPSVSTEVLVMFKTHSCSDYSLYMYSDITLIYPNTQCTKKYIFWCPKMLLCTVYMYNTR